MQTKIDTDILKRHALTLYRIKTKLFKEFCNKIEYLKVYKETGIYPCFYEEVMELNAIIESLDYNIKHHSEEIDCGE